MSRVYGVISARVTAVDDPEGLGRVKVEFPWMEGKNETYYAPIATLMAGADRGAFYMPEVGDEALVAFDQGDVNHPLIVGFLWHGASKPPTTDRHRRLIRSVNGHEIELYDPDPKAGDMGLVRLKDAHGNVVELSNGQIKIESAAVVMINAPHVFINGRRVLNTAGVI